jgi:cytochrome c553
MKHALFALASLLVVSGAAVAATPEKVTVCAACHGADGKSTQPIYPNLAGQYQNYLAHALQEYRAGKRKNPIMGAQAAGLTDKDIAELAEYYSAQPSPLYTPSIHTNARQ